MRFDDKLLSGVSVNYEARVDTCRQQVAYVLSRRIDYEGDAGIKTVSEEVILVKDSVFDRPLGPALVEIINNYKNK